MHLTKNAYAGGKIYRKYARGNDHYKDENKKFRVMCYDLRGVIRDKLNRSCFPPLPGTHNRSDPSSTDHLYYFCSIVPYIAEMNNKDLEELIKREDNRCDGPERLMQLRSEALRASDAYFACLYSQLKKFSEFRRKYEQVHRNAETGIVTTTIKEMESKDTLV